MFVDKNVNLIGLNVDSSVGKHFLRGEERFLVGGARANTLVSPSLEHHPRSSTLPRESHKCIRCLDHDFMLIRGGAKFCFSWPGLNHSWAFFFSFWLHPNSWVQNSPPCFLNMSLTSQKSSIPYCHCWPQCMVNWGFSSASLAPDIFRITGQGTPPLNWLPWFPFVIFIY